MPTMTIATASIQGRSFASDLDAVFARVRTAWMQRRAYRRTLAELRDLPAGSLRDLGFARTDLAALARRAVYGR